MAQENFPTSYRDASYDALDDASAKQVGINPALLKSVRTNGERSNADQVSSAGATTPYQFIPSTRKAILEKYGIDVALNPRNASLGAAYLLKEAQDRNKGDEASAVAEYHGGTDRANHGPITRAYVNRVLSGTRKAAAAEQANQQATQDAGLLDFARSIRAPSAVQGAAESVLSAATGAAPAQASEAPADTESLLDFAKSIRTPEPTLGERIGDVVTGRLRETEETRTLPDWATMPELNQLSLASAKTGLGTLLAGPEEIAKIVKSNFPDAKVRQDEKGNYLITSPTDGKEYAIKPGFQASDIPRALGALAAFSPAGAARTVVGQGLAAAGTQAAIEATQAATGGEFNAKDVAAAGALGAAVPAASRAIGAVGNAVRGAAGRGARPAEAFGGRVEPTLAPAETAAARTEQAAQGAPEAPNIDINGTSTTPGTGAPRATAEAAASAAKNPLGDLSDLALQQAGEVGPGGRLMRGMVSEKDWEIMRKAGIVNEGVDESGRVFEFVDGYALGAARDARNAAQRASRNPVTNADRANGARKRASFYERTADDLAEFEPEQAAIYREKAAALRKQADELEATGETAPSRAPEVQTPAEASSVAPDSGLLPASELNAAARKAAEGGIGSSKARQTLAEQAAPDAETVAAAERLGIADNLQPDHVTTNQAYRELAQAVKSVPGSEARAAEIQGLESVAKRADDLVTELGGTDDLSTLSAGVRQRMQASQTELEEQANKLYRQIREKIPAKTPVQADNILQFVERRADELGGKQNLSSLEKMVMQKLSTKGGRSPSYALLDDVRQEIGAATKGSGAFKDADTGLAKRLYNLISEDQAIAVEPHGASDLLKAAKGVVSTRKALEDDMVALFGKNLGDSVVGDISRSVTALGKGDTAQFLKLIQAVPKDLRQQVAASGLNYALGKGAKAGTVNFNTFARWYEGLQKNQQAYNALMANLPPEARQGLQDLHRVADGISKATRERITTGRIQSVQQDLKGADGLIARIYDVAKRSATGLAAEAVTAPIGLPGAGISAGIASALTKGKPDILKAADKVISSPEFIAIARSVERGEKPKASTIRQLAKSGQMRDFAKRLNDPEAMRDREKWLMSIVQSANETQH